jgi:hypothetical protein
MDDKNGFCPQKKSETFCSDKLNLKITELEVHIRGLDFEVRKLKEALLILHSKIDKKPLNYFNYSDSNTDEEENHYFYLDHINGI